MEKNVRIWLSAMFIALLFGVAIAQEPIRVLKEASFVNSNDTTRFRGFHSATNQVHLMHASFPISTLNTTAEIWIYLPEGYAESNNRFPVIYFTGGDHMFSDSLSFSDQEWFVDETLDSLQSGKSTKSILVAIHNFIGDTSQIAGAADFMHGTLKPYIDSVYRTQKNVAVIAGHDLNAALALYTTLKYPKDFNRAGIFSPRSDIYPYLKTQNLTGKGHSGMLFFYEGKEVSDLYDLTDQIAVNSKALLYTTHEQNPKRFESPMGGWFPEFYKWIFSNGYNHIIRYKL